MKISAAHGFVGFMRLKIRFSSRKQGILGNFWIFTSKKGIVHNKGKNDRDRTPAFN